MVEFWVNIIYENLPSWYPAELFEVGGTSVHMEWYANAFPYEDISAIFGYKELVNGPTYLYKLAEFEAARYCV